MDAPSSPNLPNPNVVPGGVQPTPPRMPTPDRPAAPQAPAASEVAAQAPSAPELAPAVGATPAAPNPTMAPAIDPMSLAMSQPVPAAQMPTAAPSTAPSVPLPNLAADVDVIEPEWVDKAEEVVRAHLGDPYGEEEAVEALQEDYLQKRYGFTVHEPDDDTTKTDTV